MSTIEDWRYCPECGQRLRAKARRCWSCGENLDDEEEEDRPWERPQRSWVRRDCEPHRGAMVLTLGIISIVLSVIGLPCGIIAWVMGQRDLKKIQAKIMDPAGKGLTQAGLICGIIGTILQTLALAAMALWIGALVVMISAATRMAPRPAPPSVPSLPAPAPRPVPLPVPGRGPPPAPRPGR